MDRHPIITEPIKIRTIHAMDTDGRAACVPARLTHPSMATTSIVARVTCEKCRNLLRIDRPVLKVVK